MKANQGLTVIELMVVVLIIALVSTIGVVAIRNAQVKARDAKRAYDLSQYAKALVIYSQEHGGNFPDSNYNGPIGCGRSIDSQLVKYIPNLPRDPLDVKRNCSPSYYYIADNVCSGNIAPTIHVKKMETSNPDYHVNTCRDGSGEDFANSADYLIIVR
jgi:prepilin-type N-terminal cleavage/methylation domain-containing protein